MTRTNYVAMPEQHNTQARFLHGSIMKHVITMTTTSALGLVTLFMVDLVDMYFLSLLGEIELAAAVGYSGSILFFTTSISIGIAIACGALVSKSIGENDKAKARRYIINIYVTGALFAIVLAGLIWLKVALLLELLGATGRTRELATQYLRIIIPTMPIMVIAMCAGAALRAVGAAALSMYATVTAGIVNAALDPIFIFGFGMGIKGAAWASVAARVAMMVIGLYASVNKHGLLTRFRLAHCIEDLPKITAIALPAILTNISTPIGNAYVTASMADFGDSAVAAMSVIGRIIPVAFGVVFALSGAVGPIVGQNFGAKKYDRVSRTLSDSVLFTLLYVVIISIVLFATRHQIPTLFSLSDPSSALVVFFCTWIVFTFFFNGVQFVGNAIFNNLGFAKYSTMTNFGKATLGTIPFVYVGAYLADAKGVLAGQAIGSVVFGLITYWICRKLISDCAHNVIKPGLKKPVYLRRFPLWPYSSNR